MTKDDYADFEAFARRMRETGATSVLANGICVNWAGPPQPSAAPVAPRIGDGRKKSAVELERELQAARDKELSRL